MTIFFIIVLVFSAILHECAHGYMAEWLGDSTARYAGRLTLNPIPHLDPIGSIILPVLFTLFPTGLFFAYAKPVPFNPYNLRNQKYGPGMVAAAGPLSNLLLAFVFGFLSRYFTDPMLVSFLVVVVKVNVSLAIFNLVPIPPLDGSKVLFTILPDSLGHYRDLLEKNGWIFLLIFIWLFSAWLSPIIDAVVRLFV